MYTVQNILRAKGSNVYTIGPKQSVLQAAQVMNQHKIGSLVVLAEGAGTGDELVGIITERDILTRVVAEERAPAQTLVEDVMTRAVLTCQPSTPLSDVRRMMTERKIRHLPVIENHKLCGMVSVVDLNRAQTQALEHTVEYLEGYIQH
jgi:CBS domain-containing protein